MENEDSVNQLNVTKSYLARRTAFETVQDGLVKAHLE
jgi:hypothetical protein